MRNTKQKELILNIINHSDTHPTAFEIYEEAKKELPNIRLGTVYRNLNTLLEMKQIMLIKEKDVNHFDNVHKKHFHFICTNCSRIIDIYEDYEIDSIVDGNIVMDYEINMTGICKDCLKKGK